MSKNIAVEYVPVKALKPYERNARTHSPEQIKQLVNSINEFGFTNPLLVDKNNEIIAGHGRLEAAKRVKMIEVPVIRLEHLSETQKRALVIADNKLALNAGWDETLLGLELAELKAEGFNLELTGFDLAALGALGVSENEGLTDPDDIPDAPDPVTQPGDLWVLGNHRLLCGDSTVATDVERLLSGVKPHLMVTDPPYGVNYDANWRNEADRANGKPYGARAVGKVENDDRADWSEAWVLFPGDVAYVWHAGSKAHIVAESLFASGFEIRAQVVWAKNNMVIGRGHYHPKHEPCWYAVKKNGTGHWAGDRKQTTLWQIDKPMKSETGHSTQKPVECMRRPIVNNSSLGQAVYEPFSGSGTTIIAAEMEGRHCYAMELSPEYVDIAVKRWEEFTGKKAERVLDAKLSAA